AEHRPLFDQQHVRAQGTGIAGGGEARRARAYDRELNRRHRRAETRMAALTTSAVIGSCSTRAPVALAIALPMAAATGTTGGSPTPFAPNGPCSAGTST